MLARLLEARGEDTMKRFLLAVFTTLLLALAGCSGNSATSGPTPTPSSSPPASAGPATSSPRALMPVSDCMDGRYRLVRFVGVGEKGTYGTGQDGDVTVTFNDDSYLLRGAGKEPIKLTLAGQNGRLFVDGTISGGYRVDGDKANFTVGRSSGSATLNVGNQKQSLPMAEVGNVLAPDGEASLACEKNALIVTLQDVRLELGKV
ncbi:MAG: hypothetical protein ACJ72M_23090 [Propionibacteriaceae bacterium]|jgi:hypothetical protein